MLKYLKRYSIKDYDFWLVILMIVVTVMGILVIGSASSESNQNKQILGLALGLFSLIVVSLVDYHFVLKFRVLFYLVDIGLLLSVIFFGVEVFGAKRWLEIEQIGLRFQPSELSKVIIILFFAGFFEKHMEKLNTVKILLLSVILAAFPMALVVIEDLSTTVVTLLIFITILFIAGISYKIIVVVLAIGIPAAVILIYEIFEGNLLKGYQLIRILAWRYPDEYPDDSMQQQNAIIAFASGRLWGKGLYNSGSDSVKNGGFISEPQNDFIFAVVGEELGFVGSAAIVILLFAIAVRCLYLGIVSKDLSGRIICCGMSAFIAFQTLINVCVVTGLLPNTGLPLPFVSYGLTSLVTLYLGMGVVLNVGLQRRKAGRG